MLNSHREPQLHAVQSAMQVVWCKADPGARNTGHNQIGTRSTQESSAGRLGEIRPQQDGDPQLGNGSNCTGECSGSGERSVEAAQEIIRRTKENWSVI